MQIDKKQTLPSLTTDVQHLEKNDQKKCSAGKRNMLQKQNAQSNTEKTANTVEEEAASIQMTVDTRGH